MYKHFIVLCTVSCIAICFTTGWAQPRENDPDFQAFLEQIVTDILMPIKSRGVSVNNQQRAMIIGYALKRQAEYLGEYEADKTRLNRLKENAKVFLSEISPDIDSWSLIDEAFRGRYDNEVLRLCGDPFKWSPIFTSIGGKALEEGVGAQENFGNYPHRDVILGLTEELFMHWRAREYQSMLPMFAGRMIQEFTNSITQMESDPEARAQMNQIAANLEWRFLSGRVLGDNPPRVSLKYQIKEINDWYNYEIVFLLDAGTWKIIRLDR